ncbi:MAG: 3-hydroxyacyl-ACP dehydratase FabZ family protein [Planctomycetia bacterium]|nr:3-hydroxyacyl-ACP dehydratase FabZ family protein [Planctomycetia bacterium]
MKFSLIDKIISVEPGKSIIATKSLTMAEEYLKDHFPKFPVMPGVLMIEAMTQASAWLLRISDQFKYSIVILKEARNVKFGKFLQPGQTLQVSAVITKESEHEVVLKTEGTIDGQTRIRAILTISRYNLAEKNTDKCVVDNIVVNKLKNELAIIWDGNFLPKEE